MINFDKFRNHLFFLFLFTLIFGAELGRISGNLQDNSSIMMSKPILISENIFETISNVVQFSIPVFVLIMTSIQKNLSRKILYIFSAVPLILTQSVLNILSIKSLYIVKILLLFIVVMFLMKYLGKADVYFKSDSAKKK